MTQHAPSPYSNHDEIWLLLPWYLNSTLEASEAEMVKSHLQVCLLCRKELAAQQQLANKLRVAGQVEISAQSSFERLMERIQAETLQPVSAKAQKPTEGASAPPWFAGLTNWLASPQFAYGMAMGMMILAVSWMVFDVSDRETHTYHTVANAGALGQFTKNDVRVVFAEHVLEKEITQLIHALGGSIVDGPTASGVYTVRITGNGESENSFLKSVEALRASKQVVLAEPALPVAGE